MFDDTSASADAPFPVGTRFETPKGEVKLDRISRSTVNGECAWVYDVNIYDDTGEYIRSDDVLGVEVEAHVDDGYWRQTG